MGSNVDTFFFVVLSFADLLGLVKSTKNLKFLDVTMKEAATGTLLAAEVFCWFYVGEYSQKPTDLSASTREPNQSVVGTESWHC